MDIPIPIPEPADLEKASLVDFSEIEKELIKFEEQIKGIEKKVNKVIESAERLHKMNPGKDHVEPFKSRMCDLIHRSKESYKVQKENLSESRKKFPETVEFFKYKPKCNTESDRVKEFFGHWIPFCSDFKDIFKNEKSFRVREEVMAAKRMANERMAEAKQEATLRRQEG